MGTIVSLVKLKDKYTEQIRRNFPDWNFVQGSVEEMESYLREAEVLLGWDMKLKDWLSSPECRLKWIQAWSAGVDKIPLTTLKERGIILTNASGVHAYPISETIFAMMLGLTRRLHTYIRNQQKHFWGDITNLAELHGKTLGILGYGAIGKETAKIAKAFGMTVLGYKRSSSPDPYLDELYTTGQLNLLLPRCDYVVNILPLSEETRHLIGNPQFDMMKKGAYFINVGRGGTVDTDALISALEQGILAGAGLDVFEVEPLPEDHKLWDMENVIMTPHNSGMTSHYHQRALHIFKENLKQYSNGEQPGRNRVDLG